MIEMIGRPKKYNMKGYFTCLDIKKVYDRVDRKVLCAVLRRIGIDARVANIISSMYEEDTKAVGEVETGWVKSVGGVRQGCTLSYTLFGLYTEEQAVRVRRTGMGIRVLLEMIGLPYADDIAIMSECVEKNYKECLM